MANNTRTLHCIPLRAIQPNWLTVGRPEYKQIADQLREELQKRIVAAGEPETIITPIHYYA